MAQIFAIDNTALSMYKSCPEKYRLGILEGYRPNAISAPLSFGSAWNDCTEELEKNGLPSAIRKAYTFPLTFGGDNRRTRWTLIRGLVWYHETYKNDIFKTLILPNGKPALELTFRVELPVELKSASGVPVYYTGHIDRVVTYMGQVYAFEKKHTVSYLTDNYFARYEFSAQIMGYVFALNSLHQLEAAGAVIDSVSFAVNSVKTGRKVVQRAMEHVPEWLADTFYWIAQLDNSLYTGYWPRNTESCNMYSGCQFREVCYRRPGARQAVLEADFHVEKWDPAAVRGDE